MFDEQTWCPCLGNRTHTHTSCFNRPRPSPICILLILLSIFLNRNFNLHLHLHVIIKTINIVPSKVKYIQWYITMVQFWFEWQVNQSSTWCLLIWFGFISLIMVCLCFLVGCNKTKIKPLSCKHLHTSNNMTNMHNPRIFNINIHHAFTINNKCYAPLWIFAQNCKMC